MTWWRGTKDEPKADPLVPLVMELIKQQHEMTMKVLEVQKDQNESMRKMVDRYFPIEPNVTSSLDQRLFAKEDAEWDEIVTNPFTGVGE